MDEDLTRSPLSALNIGSCLALMPVCHKSDATPGNVAHGPYVRPPAQYHRASMRHLGRANIPRRRGVSGHPRVTPTLHRTEILNMYSRFRDKSVGRIPEDEVTSCLFGPLRMMAAITPSTTWSACLHLFQCGHLFSEPFKPTDVQLELCYDARASPKNMGGPNA